MKQRIEIPFLVVAFGLLCAFRFVGCATTGPNPCIGSYAARQTMPCTCPGTLDPACAPFPDDNIPSWAQSVKEKDGKKVCYRVRMGCTPAAGSTSCVAAPLGVPQEIPCVDNLKPHGGTDP